MIRLPRDSKVMHIFVDESGDAGFGKSSSNHMVIVLFIPKDPNEIKKCFKRIRQRKWRKKYKSFREFKWSESNMEVRNIVLSELSKRKFDAYCIICVKSKIYGHLKYQKLPLLSYLTGVIVEQIIAKPDDKRLQIVVDKFLSKRKIGEYNTYIEERIRGGLVAGKEISIEHLGSASEPNLQAADMIAGAVFQKYEKGDSNYYDLIKGHVKKEDIRWN